MARRSREEEFFASVMIIFSIVMIIIINLYLAWIQFNRFLFWFDVIFIPISFIALIISVIAYFVDDWNQDDWFIIGAISLGVCLLTTLTIAGAYDKGYSDKTIETKAELEKMLEDYTFILSIYTGEFKLKVQGMVMDEFAKSLCEAAPNTPCDQVIQKYNSYKKLVGCKKSADKISNIWR